MAETAVWPTPFLINMFIAFKGSQFYLYLHTFDQTQVAILEIIQSTNQDAIFYASHFFKVRLYLLEHDKSVTLV